MELPPPPAGPQPGGQVGEIELTGGQKFGLAIIAAAALAASRGRIDPTKAEKAIRFGAKAIVGTGALHLGTTISGHGNPPVSGFQYTPVTGSGDEIAAAQISPSGQYRYLFSPVTGQPVRVPAEFAERFIQRGLFLVDPPPGPQPGEPEMQALWAADP